MRRAFLGLIAVAAASAVAAGCGTGKMTAAERGEQVFKTCAPCHGEAGTGNLTLRAPAIAGLPEWYVTAELTKFRTNVRGAHPDDEEGARMRPMARSLYHPGDLEAVAHYVSGLRPVWIPPAFPMADTAAGRASYTGVCVTCHGPDGHGNQALGAPPIAQQADWYLVAQLRKFHDGMRGTDSTDTFGAQMRAMSLTLPDTAAMHDVVAYVKTLPH